MAGETMSISELLGLDSPRGLLGSTFGNSSPGLSPTENLQRNAPMSAGSSSSSSVIFHFQDHSIKPYNEKSGASQKRNIPLSAGSSTASPPIYYPEHSMRSFWDPSGCNDSSGSNSPSAVELSPPLSSSSSSSSSSYNPVSRSNSPADSDNSAISSPDGSLTEFLNFLTLNDAFTRNYLNNEIRSDLDLNNLQNLQVIHAMKYLQQPPAILNSLLNSTCSHNTSTNQLPDKWCSAGGGGAAANHLRLMQLKLQENNNHHLDRAARFHRSAAAVFDATCTWSGVLPIRSSKPIGYSNKVFLGGVPWDISEQLLVQTFKQFGPIRVEWPGKDKQAIQPKGYCYIILEGEKNVKALLNACSNNFENSGNWYFKISSKRMKSKEVQVIPWILNDSNYTKSSSQKLDPSKTVFVGALHGMLNAEGLANIMNDLFDGVVYAGIDTDKYKYPIGSGRVTFNNHRSYMRAVSAAFIEIKTAKFTKKVQVDPYLEDSLCSVCALQQGPYFCREQLCFRYYCRTCWQYQHNSSDCQHKPLMRNSKNSTVLGLGNANLAAN